MTTDHDLRAALRRLEDREAIRDLHTQYCFVHDRGHASHAEADVQAFLALCHPDVVWDNSADGSHAHRGQPAVAAGDNSAMRYILSSLLEGKKLS